MRNFKLTKDLYFFGLFIIFFCCQGIIAQDISVCGQPDFQEPDIEYSLSCNSGSYYNDNDEFFPQSDDAIKTIKLRFVFLQKPGDEATGTGGFHLSNDIHRRFFERIIDRMNLNMANFKLHPNTSTCMGPIPTVDTRIRWDVEMINYEDQFYWDNLNGGGYNISNICPNWPPSPSLPPAWYAYPLDAVINGLYPEKRINIFFTENSVSYNDVNNNPNNIVDSFSTDCSSYAEDINSYKTPKVHMLNEFISFQNRVNGFNIPSGKYWVDDEDDPDFAVWGPTGNFYHTLVQEKANLIIHENFHFLGLFHEISAGCNIMTEDEALWQDLTKILSSQLKKMHKALSVMSVRDYVSDCPIIDRPFVITTDKVWDYDIRLYQDLIIESGATLTLQCKLSMPPGTKVVVKRGAKLIIDGAEVTSSCDDKWEGIEVWGSPIRTHELEMGVDDQEALIVGDYISTQLVSKSPGMVIIKDDASIENAVTAISTKNSDEPENHDYYGGIIYAENATFHNNRRAVEFMKYDPKNLSQFKACLFSSDLELTAPYVTLWDVENVLLNDCRFSGTNTGDERAIFSIDAGYKVKHNNIFENLKFGIFATSAGQNLNLFIGNEDLTDYDSSLANRFNNCRIGVYLLGANEAKVFNNHFIQNWAGVYNDQSLRVNTKFNLFEEETESNFNTGIVYNNTGAGVSEIYKNNFVNIYNGVHAWLKNNQLKIKCNYNTGVDYNLVVTGDPDEMISGTIHKFQGLDILGENDAPASNIFGNFYNKNTHILTQNPTVEFKYIHHLNSEYIPVFDQNANYIKQAHDTYFNEICFPSSHNDDCLSPPCEDFIKDIQKYIDELKDEQSGYLPNSVEYEALEEAIIKSIYKRDVSVKETVQYYEENDKIANAIKVYDYLKEKESQREKIKLQIQNGLYSDANTGLLALSQNSQDDIAFFKLQQVLKTIGIAGRNYNNLTTQELVRVEGVAISNTSQAKYAQNILNFRTGNFQEPDYPLIEIGSGKMDSGLIENDLIKISPNPANDFIIVRCQDETKVELEFKVYDNLGILVNRISFKDSFTFNTNKLQNGIYYCTVESLGRKISSQKLLISH